MGLLPVSVPASAQAVYGFTGPRNSDGLLSAGVAHATTDLTHGHRFAVRVERVERFAGSTLPAGCSVAPGLDAVIVHVLLTNLERRPFRGIVEHFVLAWEYAGRPGGGDAQDVACALADRPASYLGELEPPIAPRGRRRVRLFYAVPTGARLVRLDYTNDDFPARFAVPQPRLQRGHPGASR